MASVRGNNIMKIVNIKNTVNDYCLIMLSLDLGHGTLDTSVTTCFLVFHYVWQKILITVTSPGDSCLVTQPWVPDH